MMFLEEIPLLSRVEHAEMVRRLPLVRRIQYTLYSALAVAGGFVLCVALATLVTSVIFLYVLNGEKTVDNLLVITLPVAFAFMVAIGFSANPTPQSILPGDTLLRFVQRTARKGLKNGLIIGFVFGVVWGIVIRIGMVYVRLSTFKSPDLYVEGIVIYAVLMALIIAPTYALFRVFLSAAGHTILYWMTHTPQTA